MNKDWIVLLGIILSSAPGLAALGYTVRLSRAKAEAVEGENELIETRRKKMSAEYADALAEASVKLIEQYRLESVSVRETVSGLRGELKIALDQMNEMQATIDNLYEKLDIIKAKASDYLTGIKILSTQLRKENITPAYSPGVDIGDLDD